MEEIIYNAIREYFKTLEYTGYLNYREVYKILTLLTIQDIADSDANGLITDKDYKLFDEMISCIMGSSCLFPYESCNC